MDAPVPVEHRIPHVLIQVDSHALAQGKPAFVGRRRAGEVRDLVLKYQ